MDITSGHWEQEPAPSTHVTLAIAAVLFLATLVRCCQRAATLRRKFTPSEWTMGGFSLRVCTYISAYMDHHDEPSYAILRIYSKSMLFLALLQWDYDKGFLAMMAILVVLESSLDCIRVLLAYRSNSKSVVLAAEDDQALVATATETAPAQLEPTNVYEDLTRPGSVAVLVFVTQVALIGLVMEDTFLTKTRSCFNGKVGCIMLTSMGSYVLYIIGVFMMCVFYVGPGNSYGKKELNPTYWLKLFLLTKGSTRRKSVVFSWTNANDNSTKTISVSRNEVRIWARFFMSYLVNSVGFLFLMHVLPVQVANADSIMGVVYKAVGMLYLVDLDDTAGNVMTVVTTATAPSTPVAGGSNYGSYNGGDSLQVPSGISDTAQFEAEKQKIIQQAMKDVEVKLQTLTRRGTPTSSSSSSSFLTIFNRRNQATDEETTALV